MSDNSDVFRYAELHCLSNFSFLRGASHPNELVEQAQSLSYQAIAITDECSVAGVVRAYEVIKNKEPGHIKLIIGSEFQLDDMVLVLLAKSRRGYGQLSHLISQARRKGKKGSYHIELADFMGDLSECLLLICVEQINSDWITKVQPLVQMFEQRCWLAYERCLQDHDAQLEAHLVRASRLLNIPITAAGKVTLHHPSRQPLQDVLTAIRRNTSVQQLGAQYLAANAERHLRSANKLRRLYRKDYLEESVRIADMCHFCLSELKYEYPKELVPEGLSPASYLKQLVREGGARRYPQGIPEQVQLLLKKELDLIASLAYEHFFITVYDLVRFARTRGILCQGRGSAANSAVCYCLGITEVNPAQVKVLFERFLSKERNEPPDIDVDFEHERREEVIQYVYEKYGRDRAALAATVITYRSRSAIRDVGKALGIEENHLSWLIRRLDRRDEQNPWREQLKALSGSSDLSDSQPSSRLLQHFLDRVDDILGFPRHLSQHVGGFVISAGPLSELVPVENASMEGRTVIQWDKNDLETLELLKVDVLALGMLTAIRKCVESIRWIRGQPDFDISQIPREDPVVYQQLQKGDSVGLFQVESRAQMSMLPRLKPKNYYDLVIQVAIVRPGPIQGGMVHPYLRRRDGLETVEYPDEAVKSVLERTLGVPIFQEQVISLAMVAAGFSGGEAEQLRRAMGAWQRSGKMQMFQRKLIQGMLERGHDLEFAERICRQIQGFGEYGFPESHAASFALLVYLSAWLKHYEPAAFCCALLNSQPMGFYSPSQLIQDARRHGVEVRAVTINQSQWDHTLEQDEHKQVCIRLGMRMVKGLSEQAAQRIVARRPQSGYLSMKAFLQKVVLSTQDREALAAAGALQDISSNRYQARWQMLGHMPATELPLQLEGQEERCLPVPSESEDLLEDYHSLGLTLGRHPMSILREQGGCYRCTPAEDLNALKHGQLVRVSGLVTGRQRPGSASGVTFVTLEDETGNINLVVWRDTASAQKAALLTARVLEVHGVMEREGEVIHVVAGRLIDRSHLWQRLITRSRDFH